MRQEGNGVKDVRFFTSKMRVESKDGQMDIVDMRQEGNGVKDVRFFTSKLRVERPWRLCRLCRESCWQTTKSRAASYVHSKNTRMSSGSRDSGTPSLKVMRMLLSLFKLR